MEVQLVKACYKDEDIYFLTGIPYDCHNKIFQNFIAGVIINSVPNPKKEHSLEKWKEKIAIEIANNEVAKKSQGKLSNGNLFSISISFFFCKSNHRNHKLDIDNYIKPIIDASATAIFDSILGNIPIENIIKKIEERSKKKWGADHDHVFRWHYFERKKDVNKDEEGIFLTIYRMC